MSDSSPAARDFWVFACPACMDRWGILLCGAAASPRPPVRCAGSARPSGALFYESRAALLPGPFGFRASAAGPPPDARRAAGRRPGRHLTIDAPAGPTAEAGGRVPLPLLRCARQHPGVPDEVHRCTRTHGAALFMRSIGSASVARGNKGRHGPAPIRRHGNVRTQVFIALTGVHAAQCRRGGNAGAGVQKPFKRNARGRR